jgi:hypothetical protein
MIVYKLTDKDGYTRKGLTGEILWSVGTVKTAGGEGDLCTVQWIHAYEHPILAVLHDPIHGDYGNSSRMWKCETDDGVIERDGQMKLGTTKLRIIKEMKKPEVTLDQRVAYGIACSFRFYVEESYVLWAERWLSGKDRSEKSANSAAGAAYLSAAEWAARAALAAVYAARAEAAEWAAESATRAAVALSAARAEECAVETAGTEKLDLLGCAREVFIL